MRRRRAGLGRLGAALLGLLLAVAAGRAAEPLRLGDFTPPTDATAPPPGWVPLAEVKRPTDREELTQLFRR